jgi:hypothetical protein
MTGLLLGLGFFALLGLLHVLALGEIAFSHLHLLIRGFTDPSHAAL